jgi:hypothetical protein
MIFVICVMAKIAAVIASDYSARCDSTVWQLEPARSQKGYIQLPLGLRANSLVWRRAASTTIRF